MKEIMDASSMKRSLVRMAHEIVEKNKGVEGLVLVGIKTRGEFLAERLKKMIDQFEECDIPCDSLDISSWRDDIERGEVQPPALRVPVQDRIVILVDDEAAQCAQRWTASCTSAGRGRFIWRCWLTADTASCRSAPIMSARTCRLHSMRM